MATASTAAMRKGDRQHRLRKAPIEAVRAHRPGQEERPQEQEDDGIAERRERLPGRNDPEDHGERRPEDCRHRERNGLGDPPDENPGDDSEEPTGPGPEARGRKGEEQGERDRAEDEPGLPAAPLEAHLGFGEATLQRVGRGKKEWAPAPSRRSLACGWRYRREMHASSHSPARFSRHRELHRTDRIGWLRAAVLGANDGIVSTASLVVGVAARRSRTGRDHLVAGVAGLVAGAMSMAAGEYVSVSSQSDTENADLERERRSWRPTPPRTRGVDRHLRRAAVSTPSWRDGRRATDGARRARRTCP